MDLLKVAGPPCPYILVTAALYLIFSSFSNVDYGARRGNALVTNVPICVVGKERAELDNVHWSEKVIGARR